MSSSSSSIIIAIAIVIVLVIVSMTALIIILLLLWKIYRNNRIKAKAYYCAKSKTESAKSVYKSTQNDNYSTVDKHHTSDREVDDGQYSRITQNKSVDSMELELFQVYDDIVDGKSIQHHGVVNQAEDITQLYSTVNTSKKKQIKNKKNDDITKERKSFSDMYAVVDKNAKKKILQDNAVDENATVDNFAKNNYQVQDNVHDEYAVVNKSAKKTCGEKESVIDEYLIAADAIPKDKSAKPMDVYAVVDKSAKKKYQHNKM